MKRPRDNWRELMNNEKATLQLDNNSIIGHPKDLKWLYKFVVVRNYSEYMEQYLFY